MTDHGERSPDTDHATQSEPNQESPDIGAVYESLSAFQAAALLSVQRARDGHDCLPFQYAPFESIVFHNWKRMGCPAGVAAELKEDGKDGSWIIRAVEWEHNTDCLADAAARRETPVALSHVISQDTDIDASQSDSNMDISPACSPIVSESPEEALIQQLKHSRGKPSGAVPSRHDEHTP
ncbi:MAG: hypothetical protein CYPHOPRED_003333, partial [Cyphobasidiales sp. Tagirdzhanova-0007]